MVIKIQKRGFSLTEILVATIVMSMIMTGVLGFVQYGGEIWRKGQNKMNAKNYSDMAFQLLKDDLLQAEEINCPSEAASSSKSLKYKIGSNHYKITVEKDSTTLTKLQENATGSTPTGSTPAKPIKIARNVKNFYVYRVSTWTFEIGLQIQSAENEDEEGNIIEPEIISSESVILLAPGVE